MIEELDNLVVDEGEPLLDLNYPEEKHIDEPNPNSNFPENNDFNEEYMDQPIPEEEQEVFV
jgi:hypothetical protein